jgi:MFS family permease
MAGIGVASKQISQIFHISFWKIPALHPITSFRESMQQPTSSQKPTSSARRMAIAAALLTLFLDLVGFSIVFPLFPAMLQYYLDLEGSAGVLGAILRLADGIAQATGMEASFTPVLFGGILGSLYSLLQFAMAPLWGAISDRYGRRNVLLVTVAGTALSYLFWVFAGSFWLLLLSRALGGVMSGNISVTTAAVADLSDRKDRAKAMGLVGATFGLGFVLGPALGALFALWNPLAYFADAQSLGLHPFSGAALGALLLTILNWIWVLRAFPETLSDDMRASAKPLAEYNPLASLFAASEPGVRRAGFLNFFFLLSFSGMEFTLSFLGVSRFGFGIHQITAMMVFVGAVLIVVQGGLVRRLAPRVGEKRMVLIGVLLVIAGFTWLSQASSMGALYGALATMATGAGIVSPCLSALLSLYASESAQGGAMGSFRAWGSLARAFGPLLAGFVFWWAGSATAYLLGALLLIIPLAIGWALPKARH